MHANIRRLSVAAGLVLACAVAAAQTGPAGRAQSNDLKLAFEQYSLPNGLSVILSVDKTTPTVAVNVWYKVGSKNEQVGRTGFAHLFEHVMFTGSGNVAYGLHDKMTEGVGGQNNGTTNNDRTNYYETVPSNYLETVLWLESDRMGFLLDALDLAKLNAQRDIVKNERRQGMDNQPYGRASEILTKATYPVGHPYSWEVIGSMEDLSAATEEDVKNFFRLYYAPNNAYIAIVGDFDPAQAKTLVAKYFGDIPRGKPITRPAVKPVVLSAEKRLVFEDRVQVPRLYIQWPTIGVKHDDRFALDILGAILSGSRTARITKALVYDEQAAASVFAGQSTYEDVGDFSVTITPRPGHTLTTLEAAADAIIERLKKEGPTAEELQRAIAVAGDRLERVLGDEGARRAERRAGVKPIIEKALSPWPKAGERPSFSYPAAPEPKSTTIFLVDKPGAAQSTFVLGRPGPPRSTPDYFALQVMNTMLGGMFQSRLNANIREEKGYSYGVRSQFGYGKGPGAFSAFGDIVSDKSDAALVEFMKELRGILGARPVTDEELSVAKDALIQRLPSTFESVTAINGALTTLWTQGLPDGYYQQYAKSIGAVTKDDVVRVAKKYIDVDRLAIVIVGDRGAIEAALKATSVAPIVHYDIEGNPAK